MNIIPLENVQFFLFSSAFLHHICMIFALDSVFINKKIRSIGSLSPPLSNIFQLYFKNRLITLGFYQKTFFDVKFDVLSAGEDFDRLKRQVPQQKISFPVAFFITWKIESPLLWSKWNNLFWNSSKIVTVNLFFLYRT